MTAESATTQSAAPSPLTARLITCSFRGDLELCRMLCESIDRFVPESIKHALYVPAQDLKLFAEFASSRRILATQESLLPRWLKKMPMPRDPWRRRLRLPRRNVYLTPYGLPVRGWIAQQLMKISAAISSGTDVIIHIDSDSAFIRPLTFAHFVRDGRVRLYRHPEPVPLATHRRWHEAAGHLLGLPPNDFYDAEYIDPLVVWRPSVTRGMTERIEAVTKQDWCVALTRTPHFAEYILYGIYADKVAGLDAAGLYADPRSLCLSKWSGGFSDATSEADFIAGLKPEHVTCTIQSTISASLAERRRIFERLIAGAAEQDHGAAGESPE